MSAPTSVAEALDLLRSLGAPERLVRHGEIVAEVASEISREMTRLGVRHDEVLVVVGAALHDAGKIAQPEELVGPGNKHEAAGEELLLHLGLPAPVARVCRTHGAWDDMLVTLDDRLVALADHVWKGTRDERLESLVARDVAHIQGIEQWEAFLMLDKVFEEIASGSPERLAKART